MRRVQGRTLRDSRGRTSAAVPWEFDDSALMIGLDRREDPPVGPEVRMRHVLALDGSFHFECDAAEVLGAHHFS